ncbi:MAG TPA: hypothetical protein VEZ18_12415, partial [Geodermatophilus sp.]|nr:hypothetical protein [Geodermatophilus sp.]
GLVRADRRITGGANQPIIRDCFAWREIAPVPNSLLLRPHTLADCGLRPQQATESPTRVVLVGHGAGAPAADGPRVVAATGGQRAAVMPR